MSEFKVGDKVVWIDKEFAQTWYPETVDIILTISSVESIFNTYLRFYEFLDGGAILAERFKLYEPQEEFCSPYCECGKDKPLATKATDFLEESKALLVERGKNYDQEDGERSMGKTVKAFNIITGHILKESEGWLLLQLLKDVRQWSKESYHEDSAKDGVTYSALKAEALAKGE